MDNKYYELHVTVQPDDVLAFLAVCAKTKAKPLYIQLSEGRHQDQLMLAQTHMLKNDEVAKGWANDYTGTLNRTFNVLRTKLESRLTEGPVEYYEAHWKFDFSAYREYWSCAVLDFRVTHPHILHSRNLLDTRIHYLSQRIYNLQDPVAASTIFNKSGEDIAAHGFQIKKVHYERVVWDSCPAIDNGWVV
jgi:hypothetical protein